MSKRPLWVRLVGGLAIVIAVLEIPLNIVALWLVPRDVAIWTLIGSLIVAAALIGVLVQLARWQKKNITVERRPE